MAKGAQLSDTVRTLLKRHATVPAAAAESASAEKPAGKSAGAPA
jgi:ribosomal protein S16